MIWALSGYVQHGEQYEHFTYLFDWELTTEQVETFIFKNIADYADEIIKNHQWDLFQVEVFTQDWFSQSKIQLKSLV